MRMPEQIAAMATILATISSARSSISIEVAVIQIPPARPSTFDRAARHHQIGHVSFSLKFVPATTGSNHWN